MRKKYKTMDVLSDVLRTIRLSGCVYFRSDFAAPWGMAVDTHHIAQFHMVVRGQCWLRMPKAAASVLLSAGDIVVFPFGDAHAISDQPDSPCAPGMEVLEAYREGKPMFQGESANTTLVCGHFEFDRGVSHPLLHGLPPFIHIKSTDRHQLSWLQIASNIITQETDSGHPGSEVVVDRLAEVLFIQVLRTYMLQSAHSNGYLAALQDRHISEALRIIHEEPQASLTLDGIARRVGMSRSAFAARFKQLAGVPPMVYITDWRMLKARELLKSTHLPLPSISSKVGYASEAAFNRAFKRRFRQSPGTMRRALQNAGPQNPSLV